MRTPAPSADPLDRLDLVVDQDTEPADVDQFLDAFDRIVERRLEQHNQNETGGPARPPVSLIRFPSTPQSRGNA